MDAAFCNNSLPPMLSDIAVPILPKTSPPLKFTCVSVLLAKDVAAPCSFANSNPILPDLLGPSELGKIQDLPISPKASNAGSP